MKTNKKAFTIVELVIVIAVIAILAAVLIPTFSNIIKKAQTSSDTQLIRNLNGALAMDLAEKEENKHATANEAFKVAEEAGYNVAKIVSKSGYNIAWESTTGHFVLLDEQNNTVLYPVTVTDNEVTTLTDDIKINYFVVRTNVTGDVYNAPEKYSLYAGINFTAKTINLNGVGFDAGSTEGIETVNYVNKSTDAKTVIIYTNTFVTSLNVNAPLDKVSHYGRCGSVNIIAVAAHSYDEFGVVPFVEIAAGRIVLNEGSEVEQLHFNTKTVTIDENNVVIEKSENEFDKIIVAYNEKVNLPKFSRDEVVIQPTGSLVVELQDSTKEEESDSDYIWLYKQGVISQIVVVNQEITGIEKTNNKLVDTGNHETVLKIGVLEEPKETQQAAYEIANNYSGSHINGSLNLNGDEIVNLPELDEDYNVIPDTGKTIEQSVQENGLTKDIKEELKDALVEVYYLEELKEKGIEQGVCEVHIWDETQNITVNPTCFEDGYVIKTCSVCSHTEKETLNAYGHNINNPYIIGIYCNYCKHPVAFVDEIADFTVEQENDPEQLMRIFDISNGLNFGSLNNPMGYLYLDVAYSFKAFPDMSNKTLDDKKWYKINTSTFELEECEEIFNDYNGIHIAQDGMYVTAQGIYNFFSNWKCDYYVSFNEDIKANSCGLGGYYESWTIDVGFLAPINVPANTEIPLLGYLMSNGQSNWSYEDITNLVGEFKCGFFNLLDENIGKTFTVKLRMLNPAATNGYDSQYAVDMGGFYLPNYIDVGVTNYVITGISEENAAIVQQYFAQQN